MKNSKVSFVHFFLFSFVQSLASNHPNKHHFLACISHKFPNASQVIHMPKSSSYLSVLDFSAQNPIFTTPQTPRPLIIITPLQESHIKATILCCEKYDIQIRIRSGGHDIEGVSYVSQVPFVILDMINFQSVKVNAKHSTAWVGAGATIGQIHYYIALKSKKLAFPTGTCPTVGAGGHISGGGMGMLARKYGLSADNVMDARLIDVHGRVLDRKSMGEDLFWAIRGGGGASFGVILAWKLKLVRVPSKVTVFTIGRTLEQNATNLLYQWQSIGHQIENNLSWKLYLTIAVNPQDGRRTVLATFTGVYLGRVNTFLRLMQKSFPQLGLTSSDCKQMSWLESVMYVSFVNIPGIPNPYQFANQLLNRTNLMKVNLALKSDVVKQVIPKDAFEGVWKMFNQEDLGAPWMVLTGLGGKMSRIQASKIPFPHRKGNLYILEYQTIWFGQEANATVKHINWIRRLHKPYVSKSPRQTYLNYRDLDLGVNNVKGNTSYGKAKVWGELYYLGNFKRLAYVKTCVGPSNFFRFEQSIPLLHR